MLFGKINDASTERLEEKLHRFVNGGDYPAIAPALEGQGRNRTRGSILRLRAALTLMTFAALATGAISNVYSS